MPVTASVIHSKSTNAGNHTPVVVLVNLGISGNVLLFSALVFEYKRASLTDDDKYINPFLVKVTSIIFHENAEVTTAPFETTPVQLILLLMIGYTADL